MGQRRKYTPEYRRDAASLVVDNPGTTIAAVARDLGLGEQLLGKWVKAERERRQCETSGEPTTAQLRAENARLSRENARLRMEVEFLGKASAFFAARAQNSTDLS